MPSIRGGPQGCRCTLGDVRPSALSYMPLQRPSQKRERPTLSDDQRQALAERARYVGSDEHKIHGWWARFLGRVSFGADEWVAQGSKRPRSARSRLSRSGTWLRSGCGARFTPADTASWRLTKTSRRKSGTKTKVVRSGLVGVLIRRPASTRVGLSTRNNDVRFSIDWIGDGPNASAEERATRCDLQIVVNDKNLCRHSTPSANEPFDHLTIPAVHLAEGLATDWWSILGGRDRKHPVLRYRMGFALPKLLAGDLPTLVPRRQTLSLSSRLWARC